MRYKYICFEDAGFVIFGDFVNHADMARRFSSRPVSAGFCYFNENGVVVPEGKSDSLKLKSEEKDNWRLNGDNLRKQSDKDAL